MERIAASEFDNNRRKLPLFLLIEKGRFYYIYVYASVDIFSSL